MSFVINGYHIIETDLGEGFNRSVYDQLDSMPEYPQSTIMDIVPKLGEVFEHPKVAGAFTSLLGTDYLFNNRGVFGAYCHKNVPGSRSQYWHQDDVNRRHHHVERILAMYYPQDVAADMGPTALVPGTHLLNGPTERMATYGNFKHQVVTTVKAGTVVIIHNDIWHGAAANTSDQVRYMLKLTYDRVSDPTEPSWNHDAAHAAALYRKLMHELPVPVGQTELYKCRYLRRDMWAHLTGGWTWPD